MEESHFESELKIRDQYASDLARHRPCEVLIAVEAPLQNSRRRVDMRTLDPTNITREWEFKLVADYRALGQLLTYVALARDSVPDNRIVRGVLAAFEFAPDVELTNERMNLGLELVQLPNWLRRAGAIPNGTASTSTFIHVPTN